MSVFVVSRTDFFSSGAVLRGRCLSAFGCFSVGISGAVVLSCRSCSLVLATGLVVSGNLSFSPLAGAASLQAAVLSKKADNHNNLKIWLIFAVVLVLNGNCVCGREVAGNCF